MNRCGFQVESEVPMIVTERLRIAVEVFELDAWSGEVHGRANTMAFIHSSSPLT